MRSFPIISYTPRGKVRQKLRSIHSSNQGIERALDVAHAGNELIQFHCRCDIGPGPGRDVDPNRRARHALRERDRSPDASGEDFDVLLQGLEDGRDWQLRVDSRLLHDLPQKASSDGDLTEVPRPVFTVVSLVREKECVERLIYGGLSYIRASCARDVDSYRRRLEPFGGGNLPAEPPGQNIDGLLHGSKHHKNRARKVDVLFPHGSLL